jgi:hypothetical protein
MSEAQARAAVTIVPREQAVLKYDAAALKKWLERGFEGRCVVKETPKRAGDRVRAEILLSTKDVSPADRELLLARKGDQPLWRAWVEQSFVDGWCDVESDVRIES